jgi:hypothetical protein
MSNVAPWSGTLVVAFIGFVGVLFSQWVLAVMRGDLPKKPRWYLRAIACIVHPRVAADALHQRWRQDWIVIRADQRRPVWRIIDPTSFPRSGEARSAGK